ncbi:hypothetical protein VU08_05730 [Desulfobulbus sp. F5]|nr:hypothetical protein [Desulfobulbus sp. F5]
MKRTKMKVLSIIFASLLLISCDKKEKSEEQKQPEPQKPASMLSFVPDDTVFFSGGIEPVPLKNLLKWNIARFNMSKDMLTPKDLSKMGEEAKIEGQRMAAQIWDEYLATIVSPETQIESWGFEDTPAIASYTIGLSPVLLRISLKDIQKFNNKIAELEKKAKVTAKVEALGTATYRRYALNEKKGEGPHVSLVIGIDGNNGVFMIDIGVDSEKTLSLALGQSKPEKSLEQSGRLESLQEKYKLLPSWLGFIDHRQLITGLTTKDGNRMAKMVQLLMPQLEEKTAKQLTELQSEGCRNDFQAIGANWPQIVGGYTALELNAKPSHLDSIIVVESNDQPLLDGLQSLRGFIPEYVRKSSEPTAFSYGIGLNVENIAPFLTKQWTEITQKQYNCSYLKEMQQGMKAQNPAMVSMATSMAAGVRGIAFSLLSLTMDDAAKEAQTTPMPKDVDAIISLSAKDPVALVQMASAMIPPLAALKISADGTAVALPTPVPLPFPLMVAIKGSHLTVYAGKKAEQIANDLSKAPLESSLGFMAADMDYGKYYGLMGEMIANTGKKNAEAAEVFESIKNAKMRVLMDMDFTARGIEMKANMISTD